MTTLSFRRSRSPYEQKACDDDECVLTVVLPVFNECATLERVLDELIDGRTPIQLIVVDDGSTDGGIAVLRRRAPTDRFLLLRHGQNQGKGAAIRTALAHVRTDFVVVMDADLEIPAREMNKLLSELRQGRADLAMGTRRSSRARSRERVFYRLGVAFLNGVYRLLYGVRLSDQACGLKMLRTDCLLAMDLECRRFEFCSEVTAKGARMGLRILEIPVDYFPRGRREGKKIRLWDGVAAAASLWRWRRWRPHGSSVGGRENGIMKTVLERNSKERE
jgi:glycosyltransferase involved in cell wall biosynthesis